MKNIPIILILILFFTSKKINAQTTSNQMPISISYFGHFVTQPGLKIGTEFNLKQLENTSRDEKSKVQNRQLYLSPQIGYFNLSNVHSGLMFNVDIGYKKLRANLLSYSAFSIGLGYLAQSRILTFSTNLGNGEIGNENKETSSYIVPTVNYELGRAFSERFGWFGKVSLGSKLLSKKESEMVVFGELGVKFYLK